MKGACTPEPRVGGFVADLMETDRTENEFEDFDDHAVPKGEFVFLRSLLGRPKIAEELFKNFEATHAVACTTETLEHTFEIIQDELDKRKRYVFFYWDEGGNHGGKIQIKRDDMKNETDWLLAIEKFVRERNEGNYNVIYDATESLITRQSYNYPRGFGDNDVSVCFSDFVPRSSIEKDEELQEYLEDMLPEY